MQVGNRVRIVNYAPGEDVGNMEHPNGRTGEIVEVSELFIELRLDQPIRNSNTLVSDILVTPREIEVINA